MNFIYISQSLHSHITEVRQLCFDHDSVVVVCSFLLVVNSIRLVNSDSSNKLSGRVELFHEGSWGTICDDDWDIDDAHVVCRQLGFPFASRAIASASFGQGSGDILLDNVACNGREAFIEDCPSNGFRNHNCNHGEDASVECSSTIP